MADVLISKEEIATSINGAVAYRIVYRSHDLHGIATTSSGLVIAPPAAGENRRVMSWAHGTTGIDAVTIVNAARELQVGAGKRFGVIGWSQGGGTAAATVELDATDYADLEIVGAAAMSPGVPIIGLKLPGLGSALGGNDIPPDGHLFMILGAMVTAFPDTLSLDDVYTAIGKRVFNEGWNVQAVHHLSDTLGRAYKHEGQVMAVDTTKLGAWMQAFTEASATLKKPIAPVLVLMDEQDPNGPCPITWQRGYVDAVKAFGGDITVKSFPDDDHFSLPQSSIGDAKEWLTTKFA